MEKPGVLAAAVNYYRQIFHPERIWHLGQKWETVNVPTLVLWGEEDAFLSHKLVEGLDRLITAPFKLKLVPNCGHWIQQEVPQTVNRELLSFLRNSSPSLVVG